MLTLGNEFYNECLTGNINLLAVIAMQSLWSTLKSVYKHLSRFNSL